MKPPQDAKVIIRHCDSYDPERIRTIVREGLEELDLRPYGKTLVKPNLVAAGPLFEHAHTRVEFSEGVLQAIKDRDDGKMEELVMGERCGITIPTRFTYQQAGYDPMLKRNKVKKVCFEEVPQVEIPLKHKERLRDYIFTPKTVADADFFVNLPKFKAHPWTTVTFSMKNYIGIQDDRHRLIDHDHKLNEKVADLQYIIQPQFIAIDAIIGGEGRMLTPVPREMNLIIMGNNQLAFDAVCCQIIGVDPMTVDHLRFAFERGFGPVDLDKIKITGDVPLKDAKSRAEGFETGLIRIEKYFEGTNICAYAGPPPGEEKDGYCWGGCPGALEEVIEILRLYDDQTDEKMPKIHIVVGDYKGQLDVSYGEKVVFLGDCTHWEGKIGEELVTIESLYKDRATKDPHTVKHEDIYAKMLKVTRKIKEAKHSQFIRLEGCPVSVAEIVLLLSELGGIQNPYTDKRQIVDFNKSYLAWKAAMSWRKLKRQPYQINGAAKERGDAAPEVTPPVSVPPPAE